MKAAERSGEIVSAIRTTVLPEHRKELCLTISSLLGLIRSEDGCRTYRFYGEDGDQNSFILIGEWETQDAWDRHLNSDNFTVLVGSLRLLSNQADVDFKLLSHVAALATLTKAKSDP
jgi:quinol monooxygenase YgiN